MKRLILLLCALLATPARAEFVVDAGSTGTRRSRTSSRGFCRRIPADLAGKALASVDEVTQSLGQTKTHCR